MYTYVFNIYIIYTCIGTNAIHNSVIQHTHKQHNAFAAAIWWRGRKPPQTLVGSAPPAAVYTYIYIYIYTCISLSIYIYI